MIFRKWLKDVKEHPTYGWIMGRNGACLCVIPGSRELKVKKRTIAMVVPTRVVERLEISVVIKTGGGAFLEWLGGFGQFC